MPGIIVDRLQLVAFARVSGFLDAARLMDIARRVDREVEAFGAAVHLHGRLYDLSDAKVAPPEAIDALIEMTRDPRRRHLRANRVAYFGASPLVELQIARLCAFPNAAMFSNRRDAYAWATGGRQRRAAGCDRAAAPF